MQILKFDFSFIFDFIVYRREPEGHFWLLFDKKFQKLAYKEKIKTKETKTI